MPYICPGIKIGWDSNRGFTMGPKISIGMANLDHVSYVNLTFGTKAFERSEQIPRRFIYLDAQVGRSFSEDSPITVGIGFGLLFGKGDDKLKVYPRTTMFFGFIAFPTLDFNFWGNEESSGEPGLEIGLPLPLKKDEGFGLQ
ncbi:MAG: hypothetical protein ONB13_01930 [candidate division KSB1 bacterium]|nr:hypothetical protein [candidate division KSB1 bacterium]